MVCRVEDYRNLLNHYQLINSAQSSDTRAVCAILKPDKLTAVEEAGRGFFTPRPRSSRKAGDRATRPGRRRARDRVLYLAAADRQEGATGPERPTSTSGWKTFLRLPAGKLATLANLQRQGSAQADAGRPAGSPAHGGARAGPAQVRAGAGRRRSAPSSSASPSARSSTSSPRSCWMWRSARRAKSSMTKPGSGASPGSAAAATRNCASSCSSSSRPTSSTSQPTTASRFSIRSSNPGTSTWPRSGWRSSSTAVSRATTGRSSSSSNGRPPARRREPGFRAFLQDSALSGDVTTEELTFLKKLTFAGKRPTALYYYRELQNLRDPLHFSARAC